MIAPQRVQFPIPWEPGGCASFTDAVRQKNVEGEDLTLNLTLYCLEDAAA